MRQLRIVQYTREFWIPNNLLSIANLGEHGIVLDPDEIPDGPELTDPSDDEHDEYDLEYPELVYQQGSGGFWLALYGDEPIGRVGAQDIGGVAELRRMFVMPEYRRRGVGTALVRTLIAHCAVGGIRAIEVWTGFDAVGQFLYRSCGFRQVPERGPEFSKAPLRDEMRLRLDLAKNYE